MTAVESPSWVDAKSRFQHGDRVTKGSRESLRSLDWVPCRRGKKCTENKRGIFPPGSLSYSRRNSSRGGETNLITVKGTDKQQVGTVAAKLRSIKPPEPYKGRESVISESIFARRSERPKHRDPSGTGREDKPLKNKKERARGKRKKRIRAVSRNRGKATPECFSEA